MNPGELSDDELLTMLRTPQDSVSRQRARAGRERPAPGDARLGGLSDEELLAALRKPEVPRATSQAPAYKPTDYRSEANKLPATHPTEADVQAEEDRTANPFTRFMHRAVPDSRTGPGGAPRYDDPVAHDPTSQMVLAGVLGAGAGAVAAPLGRLAGAVNGATQGVVTGGHAPDVLASAAMGLLLGGKGHDAHEPMTQQEMDAATLARRPAEPPGLPEGEHGNVELASRAKAGIDDQLAWRRAGNSAGIDSADENFSALDKELGPVETFGARQRLGEIRQQSMGGKRSTLASDPTLADYQDNLSQPDTRGALGATELPRAKLRNLHKGLTNEADFGKDSSDPMAQAALKQGAGVLSDRVRTADPSGNIGTALDRYGAENDRIKSVEDLLGPESGATSKLARVGSADRHSAPAALEADREISQLQSEEPVVDELVNAIRARNTTERRKLRWNLPLYMSPENVAGSTGRNLARNFDNLRFKLAPPKIDEAGMVADKPAGHFDQAIPLELQLLLAKERQNESP